MIASRGLLVGAANPARAAADSGNIKRVLLYSALFGTGLGVISLAVGIGLLLLPESLLSLVLGDSASLAKAMAIPAALSSGALCVAMGAGLGLRALHSMQRSVISKGISFPIAIAGVAVGGAALGAPGAQYGIALSETVRSSLSWKALLGISRS
jgi:hypothetical protein